MKAVKPFVDGPASSGGAKPDVTPVALTPAAMTDEQLVRQRVADWAKAWETRNVEIYRGFYAPEFHQYEGESNASWLARRQRIMQQAGFIRVTLQDVSVSINGDTANATFRQIYRSAVLSDSTLKNLTWQRHDGRWVIADENTLP